MNRSMNRVVVCGLLTATVGFARAEEKDLLAEVSRQALEEHAREIVQHVRPSGSPGEFAAIDYIVRTLRADGIPVEVLEFEGFVSDPVRASLRLEGRPESGWPALTQAFAAPTGPQGLVGELVDCGAGRPEDYEKVDARGKIVLVDGNSGPDEVKAAGRAGAAGAVFASTSERICEMTVGPIWGAPTHKDYTELPKIPSVAVNQKTGQELRGLMGSGPVRVRLETEIATGWKPLRLAVATIESNKDPDGFVLLGGHIDAWHHGATDEGSSNAAMVELVRIFHRHRDGLERGLKVAWWTGHSNGRYAGSTWYSDRYWNELRGNAIAYLNLDVIGQVGAKVYAAGCTSELDDLAQSVMRDVVGVEGAVRRPGRNSDQSFYGIGMPLLQFYHDRLPEDGGYWFWHTPEDTFDKIDFDNLADETRLYVAALYRILMSPIPPVDLAAASGELRKLLEERARSAAASDLAFGDVLQRAERLHNLASSLQARLTKGVRSEDAPELARRVVRFVRPVIRVVYQEGSPYLQDPALEMELLPGLSPLGTLGRLDTKSDLYRFTRVYMVRELNRIADHIDQALEQGEALARMLANLPTSGSEGRLR